MSVEIIQQKLLTYQCQTIIEQENALKEIAQEIALMALSRAGFFKVAAFQGGTCLRILYKLQRFSEDLDFVLEQPDPYFDWESYVKTMTEEFSAYGYLLEVINKKKLHKTIKTAFLKANSEGSILVLKDIRTNRKKLQIKLEIDIDPPMGSNYELKYLDFPLIYSIRTQDCSSLFASKIHALLCRPYIKGRDWYDFIWYVSRQTAINFLLLTNALQQAGPFKGQNILVNTTWLQKALNNKINSIDWDDAKKDIANFLQLRELSTLNLWSVEFFVSRVDKLIEYLGNNNSNRSPR